MSYYPNQFTPMQNTNPAQQMQFEQFQYNTGNVQSMNTFQPPQSNYEESFLNTSSGNFDDEPPLLEVQVRDNVVIHNIFSSPQKWCQKCWKTDKFLLKFTYIIFFNIILNISNSSLNSIILNILNNSFNSIFFQYIVTT